MRKWRLYQSGKITANIRGISKLRRFLENVTRNPRVVFGTALASLGIVVALNPTQAHAAENPQGTIENVNEGVTPIEQTATVEEQATVNAASDTDLQTFANDLATEYATNGSASSENLTSELDSSATENPTITSEQPAVSDGVVSENPLPPTLDENEQIVNGDSQTEEDLANTSEQVT